MKKMLLILITLFALSFVYAEENLKPLTVDTFFSEKDIERTLSGEIVTRMSIKYNAWNENTDNSIYVPSSQYANEDFSIYEMISDEKAFIPYKLTEESKLNFYNTIVAYSKLQGMKYYSRRIGQVQELMVNCYRVESEKNKKRINDEVFTTIPPKSTNYFFQEDNKFGKLTFRSEVYNEGNSFAIVNTCMQPITYLVYVNRKEEFKSISYFIYDEENEGFFYYTVNPIRIRIDLALKKLSPTTFSNRLRATTVHLAKLLGLDWEDKYNPWIEEKLLSGGYKNY